jgi:hypothetical protein
MTCLEAQSKIIAYIDYKLEREEKMDFLQHIKCCENCRDELNIYYTMIEGMRQLDNNMPLSKDFTVELNERMERELKSSKKKMEFFRSSVLLVVLVLLGFGIFGYVNFLNILHDKEQNQMKEAQGQYYYSDTFEDILFAPFDEGFGPDINVTSQEPEMSFYQKIRQYEMLNK